MVLDHYIDVAHVFNRDGQGFPREERLISDIQLVLGHHVLAADLEPRADTSEAKAFNFIKERTCLALLEVED